MSITNAFPPESRETPFQQKSFKHNMTCGKVAPYFANRSASLIQLYAWFNDVGDSVRPARGTASVRPLRGTASVRPLRETAYDDARSRSRSSCLSTVRRSAFRFYWLRFTSEALIVRLLGFNGVYWNSGVFSFVFPLSLRWRHNGHDGVSNHQPHICLLHLLFGRRSKKTPKQVRVTGLNSPHKWPVTRKMFPFDDVMLSGYQF